MRPRDDSPLTAEWAAMITGYLAYLVTRQQTDVWIATQHARLKRLARDLGGDPRSVTAEALTAWAEQSCSMWAPKTWSGHKAAAGNFFGWAHRTGRISADVTHILEHRARRPETLHLSATTAARRCRSLAAVIGLRLTFPARSGRIKLVDDETGKTVLDTTELADITAYLDVHVPRRMAGPVAKLPSPAWRPWVDLFIAEQKAAKLSAETIRVRVAELKTFARFHADPLTVTREDLVAYIGNTRGPAHAKNLRTTFRIFFGMLFELSHRRDNPAGALPKVKVPRALPRPCPDPIVRQAFGAVTDPRVRLALWIAAETGLRRSEIARIRRADVESRGGVFWLRVIGKGGRERVVPLSDELAAAIREFSTSEYVFVPRDQWGNVTGLHLGASQLGRLMSQAMPDGWTAHTLRHRFATEAYAASRDLRAVQELLGHSSPTTTAIYTAVADNSLRAAASAARLSFP